MLKTSPNAYHNSAHAMLLHWQQKLLAARQRGVLQLQMPELEGLLLAEDICQSLGLSPLWVHRESAQSTNNIKQFIGQEYPAVVYNAYQKLSANHMALLAGTIKAGGLLIVLSDTKARMQNHTKAQGLTSYFLDYWFSQLQSHPAVASFKQASNVWCWPNMHALNKALDFDGAEQQQAITAINKVVLGKARAPFLLLAKRGRGKSAALGMAAATLKEHHNKNIIITGPSEQAVQTLNKHCQQLTGAPIAFWPMDKLLAIQPECDAVFVDEAAAIAVSQLQHLTEHYNRLVFATTIDGYEGSGQGFLLHFKPFLQQKFPKWHSGYLHQAIRFANNDGLENFIDSSFLLPAKVALENLTPSTHAIEYQEVFPSDLLSERGLLEKIFALLGLAHYQTSADDLQFLLEQPKARLFVAQDDDVVAGVLLTLDEGGFNPQEITEITAKPRRMPGHVLPQQLLAQGQANALALSYCRVIRIAVHPNWRRLKIASGLLNHLEQNTCVDVLGTSFSATSDVLAFWCQAGFSLAMLGSKKSTASACYSSVFLKANNNQGDALVAKTTSQCQQQLPMQLLLFNQDIPAACLPWLLQKGDAILTRAEALQVQMFCEKRLGFENAHLALAKQLCCYFQAGLLLDAAQTYVAEKLLLNVSFEQLTKRFGFSGRKAFEQAMREFFIGQGLP